MPKNPHHQTDSFSDTLEDLPLFSGTCQRAAPQVFKPQTSEWQAIRLPGLDEPPDWHAMVKNRAKIIRRRRRNGNRNR